MDDQKTYLKMMSEKILEWDKKIEELKKKGNEAASGMKEDYAKIAEDLKAKKKIADEKMQQIKTAGGEGWTEIRQGAEKALSDLSDSIDKALSKFKKQ